MGIRLGLSLLFLTAPLWAQENPRELWTTMRTQRNRPAEETEESLVEAARLFDLADVKSAEDRKEIGRTAAVALFQYLDLVEWPSRRRIPTALTEETWTYKKILAIKREDGRWLISAATRRELPDLLQEELEGTDGEVVYADPRSWFRDLFPESFRGELLMLRGWQWIGLTTLILLGVLLSVVVQFIALQIARRVAVSRGVRLEGGRKVLRPFGLIATGIVWYAGLRYLLLQETAYNILTNAARFVLMVGVVWSFCRVIDWVAEVFSGMATRTHSKLDDILVPMVRKAVKVVVVLLGVVWIAENMGQDIGALLAGLGIGGLAIALASRDTVENFFGALTIITDRPFEVGDWIKMGDIEGTVAHIGFRSTRVRTFYDSVTTFPNSMLIRSAVDNLGSRHYRRLKFELGVAYDTPADKLETFIEGIRARGRVRHARGQARDVHRGHPRVDPPAPVHAEGLLPRLLPQLRGQLAEHPLLSLLAHAGVGDGTARASADAHGHPASCRRPRRGVRVPHADAARDAGRTAGARRARGRPLRSVEARAGRSEADRRGVHGRSRSAAGEDRPAPRRVAGRRRGVTSPAAPYRGSGPTERMDGQLLELPTIDAADNKSAKKPVDTQIAFIELIAERLGLDPALQRSDGDMRNVGQVEPEVRA
jgi:MscS family membrane protein